MDFDIASIGLQAQDAYLVGAAKRAAKGAAAPTADTRKAKEAAQEFEAFFISQMMDQMMSGIETNPTFGGGHGETMWRSMLNQEYGKQVARRGGLGIADHVMKSMLQAQEARTAEAEAPALEAQANVAAAVSAAARKGE
jgi:flagellar protein FlgJ